jgi:hypothetical protein
MSEKVAFNSAMTRWIAGENVTENGTLIPNDFSYRGADKFLDRPGRKQATATENFEFHIFYL